MIFLLEYDQTGGKLLSIKGFSKHQSEGARKERLELELARRREGLIDREIVLLEAEDQNNLRRTHQRYFETFTEMAESMQRSIGANLASTE